VLCLAAGCSTPVPSAVSSPLAANPPPAALGVPVVLPIHTLTGAMPAALITGKLAFKDGCLTISDQTGTSYEAVWPMGFSARRAGDLVLIVGPSGQVFGTGGQISLGGGVFEGASAGHVRDHAINLIPMCDHEPFWLVADVSDP
jgi:hypothetical protein